MTDEERNCTRGPLPERPIPFVLFMLCVSAVGLLLLPLLGACDSYVHEIMLWVGTAFLLPFTLFRTVLCVKPSWVVRKFLVGEYSERATYRQLSCPWYPVPLQLLTVTSGEKAGNNIETYAAWETNDIHEQLEVISGGSRTGGQVSRVAGSPGNFDFNFPGVFPTTVVEMDSGCNLRGLGAEVTFDGNNLVSNNSAWAKAGYGTLERVTQALLFVFLFGVECVFVAVSMPPGVSGFGMVVQHEQMPLDVVFVVDGSGSITSPMWKEQMRAGQGMTNSFQKQYHGDPDKLSIGVVQFNDDAQVEQGMTSNVDDVVQHMAAMKQLGGGTNYHQALQACQSNLFKDAGTDEGSAFKVCVLITDGLDGSGSSPGQLKAIVGDNTSIFGIFVGDNDDGKHMLKKTTACGKARHEGEVCDFFAHANNYTALVAKVDGVVEQVMEGVDLAMCAMQSALIGMTTALLFCLPLVLWYMTFTTKTMVVRRMAANQNTRTLLNTETETAVGIE